MEFIEYYIYYTFFIEYGMSELCSSLLFITTSVFQMLNINVILETHHHG